MKFGEGSGPEEKLQRTGETPGPPTIRSVPSALLRSARIMLKYILSLLIFIFISGPAFCSETIYVKEINGFFYRNGKIKKSEGQFENTYLLEGNKIIRTRVFDMKTKKIIPDNTIYTIHRGLWSDPTMNMHAHEAVIRALGQPGTDAIEILVINFNKSKMDSIKSTADYFVISHYQIIK